MEIILLLLFASFQRIEAKLELTSTSFFLAPGSGSMTYIRHDDDEQIHHCFLSYESESINYTLAILLKGKQDFSSAPVFGNRLSNLERNLCGFRVVDVKSSDTGTFRIFANYTDSENKEQSFNRSIYLHLFEKISLKDVFKEVDLGKTDTVVCGVQHTEKSCTMFDPNGVMVLRGERKCSYNIKYLVMEHIGNWTCFSNVMNSMRPLGEVMELRLATPPNVTEWYREEGGFGLLGCQYNSNTDTDVTSCQFVSPDNTKYFIYMGSTSVRFTSIGTDILQGKTRCQIEFKLPVLEEEIGTWKCIISRKDGPIGAIIDVHSGKTRDRRASEILDYPRRSVQYVELGETFSIYCEVPYKTNNCYIKSPRNEILFGGGFDYFNLGRCTVNITNANSTHLGIWTCHFSRENVADDDILEVEIIEEYSMSSLNKDVEVDLGKSVEIMCRASIPIQSCQFIDPNGLSYNVSPDKKLGGFSYAGKGLEYGECGLKIDPVKEEHDGIWNCIIINKGESKGSLNDTVRIYVDSFAGMPTSAASAIGIPVGIMVVAVLLLGVAFVRRYKKRSPRNTRMSDISEGSNTDLPIFNLQTINTVNYDTNNNS